MGYDRYSQYTANDFSDFFSLMSRFFAAASSDSDSSDEDFSTSDNSSVSSVEETIQKKSKWMVGNGSDSESEDEVKVVKSAADKRFDEMRAVSKSITNALKIKDWLTVSNGTHY